MFLSFEPGFSRKLALFAITGTLTFALAAAAAPEAVQEVRFDSSIDGVKSPYTEKLIAIGKDWAAHPATAPTAEMTTRAQAMTTESPTVSLHAFTTPDSKSYVGFKGEMTVNVPVSKMDAVVASIDDYQKIFPGYKDIHIAKKEGNRWLTSWEQIIPVFFLSNLRYDIEYIVDHSQTDRPIYRFQLKQKGSLNAFDGIIMMEPAGQSATHYTEYDFWDADYGMLQVLAPGKIWTGSV